MLDYFVVDEEKFFKWYCEMRLDELKKKSHARQTIFLDLKSMQQLIALMIGVVMTMGYAMITYDEGDSFASKLIIGAIFGFAVASSMIANPEKMTRRQVHDLLTPILITFTLWLSYAKPDKALIIVTWCALMIAGHYFFLHFGSSESRSINTRAGDMR